MKKIVLFVFSLTIVFTTISFSGVKAETIDNSDVEMVENGNEVLLTIEDNTYCYNKETGLVTNTISNEVIGKIECERIYVPYNSVSLMSTNSNSDYYYYQGVKITSHYIYSYTDKNVLSKFANITEAIGPAPNCEFLEIVSYDPAISR